MGRGGHLLVFRAGPLWLRLLAGFVFEVVSAAVVVGVPGLWLYRHMDLARLAAAQVSAATGRAVTIGSLKVGLGRTVTIELSDAVLPNIEGGSNPQMVTLKHLVAEVDLQSLLQGPLLVRRADVDGLSVLLERGADKVPNWRFGPKRKPPADPTGRVGFPSLRDVTATASQVVYHVLGKDGGGADLVTRLDKVGIRTGGDDQPVKLTIVGAYHDVPLTLEGDLASIDALRDVEIPFPTKLDIRSGTLDLQFDGTMTDPLNFDGLVGRLDLGAPDPKPLFAVAGADSAIDTALYLEGAFAHKEPAWNLTDATGQLGQDAVDKATIGFAEGTRGQPDKLDLDLAFKTLDLNELAGSGAKGKRSGADLPLQVDRAPDTLIHARLSAGTVEYGTIRAEQVVLAGSQTEGRITVDAFSLHTFGAAITATGRIEAAPEGARISASVSAGGADVQTLRQNLGFHSLPLTGRLDGQVEVSSVAKTANAAVRQARVSAIIAIRGGAIEKKIVEMASTDVLALFRSSKGYAPVTCLLAGLDMRAGVGTVAPLRVRSADGTISGSATFDLYRRTFDLTIGSEAKTTGLFALDIPVRVYGPFGDPTVRPAKWSAQGRAALAAADDLSRLPPALREFARRNPCPPP